MKFYMTKLMVLQLYLLGHRNVFNDTIFPKGSVVLDPWRERNNKDTIYYGGIKK